MDLQNRGSVELMKIYAEVLKELNSRGVVRTYNSPVGDYAEWLVSQKLGLTLETNSQKGYDALDPKTELRYQIKSRWERGKPSVQSRELNVIRNLEENQFEFLVIVIFDENFAVKEAYQLPHELIVKYARKNRHQNGHILIAMGDVLKDPSTQNITEKLR